jgi:hypothetical protein
MQLSVPDPSVRELGREEITQIEIEISMPDGSVHQAKVCSLESSAQDPIEAAQDVWNLTLAEF